MKRRQATLKDIAVVGFTTEPLSEIAHPTLTTVSQPIDLIGKKTAEVLIEHIRHFTIKFESRETVLPIELMVRESK